MKRLWLLLAILTIAALSMALLSGCAPSARVRISLTDAVPENVAEVWVEVTQVYLKPADAPEDAPGVIAVSSGTGPINLLDLRSTPLPLGDASVPAGSYDQVRLSVKSAYVILKDGARQDLFIPGHNYSAEEPDPDLVREDVVKGVFKSGAVFEAGKQYGITIDFDVNNSLHLHTTGSEKYILRPVIHTVLNNASGRIVGKVVEVVDGVEAPVEGVAIQVLNGDVLALETATDAEGMYYANALLLSEYAGNYTIQVVAPEGYKPVESVTVTLDQEELTVAPFTLVKE